MRNYIVDSCIVSGIIWCCLTPMSFTQAQIVSDTTLPNNSAVSPLNNMSRWTITEGTVAGNNLFHSFRQFSIPERHTADFVNPSANIQNILVRVTGGSSSEIFGNLQISGEGRPNLFLMNPHGILFGRNARLRVGGSLIATTANAIAFGNQGFFSASVPNNPALLTVNPSAFLFNQIVSSSIINQSTNLSVLNGQSLFLLGSNVNIDGGTLRARGGRIELGAVAGEGSVELNTNTQNLHLNYPQNLVRGDISIINGTADVRADGGGSLTIHARNLEVARSLIRGGIRGNGTQAGDITLNATERINITHSTITNSLGDGFDLATGHTGRIYIKGRSLFSNNSTISSDVNNDAKGSTGGIQIVADSVHLNSNTLNNPTGLRSSTSGQGTTNGVLIKANNSVVLNNSFIDTRANVVSRNSNASNINIQARDIVLTNGSSLDSSSSSRGSSGNIIINAQNNLSLDNRSLIGSPTNSMASPGLIDITARTVTLTNGAAISSRTSGLRNGGNIQINATESVKLTGFSSEPGLGFFISGLFTDTVGNAIGTAGNINIKTSSLQITDGAVISARSRSAGDGGNINIIANTVDLAGGGQIVTSAFNRGNAGNITIEAKNGVNIAGRDPSFAARLEEFGSELINNDGANSGLFARVRGDESANAGNITVTASSLRLDNQGKITTETTAGEGGNINIRVNDIVLLRNNSNISASAGTASAGGNGGNINIDTKFLIAVSSENSDISANAFNGRGGRVDITAQSIFGIESRPSQTLLSDITASSEFGVSGEVSINSPEVDPIQGLSELPTNIVDSSKLLTADCSTEDEDDNSQFIVTGRGGLPTNPYELLGSDVLWSDTRAREITARRNPPTTTKSPSVNKTAAILPANGWVFNAAGEVTLISDASHSPLKSNSYACPKPKVMN